MTIEDIEKRINDIDGFLSKEEGKLLFNLAKKCQGKGEIVEIGSWKGKSTTWLASGSKEGNGLKIHAIDPHTGSLEHNKKFGKVWTFDQFKDNLKNAEVGDMVVPYVMTSEEAANKFNKPVEFIFIDGAHDYESVKLDFDLWFPRVVDGGIMAFHDTLSNFPGSERLVTEAVYKSKRFKDVKFVCSITFAKKVKENSFFDRIKNRYVLFLKAVYSFVRNVNKSVPLPKSVQNLGKKIASLLQFMNN